MDVISFRCRLLLATLAICLLGCALTLVACNNDATPGNRAESVTGDSSQRSARGQFKLSEMLVNFEEFKTKFHKSYGSFLEEISRQRLYIGHAIESVASKLAYKFRKKNWYKSINHMSDWTSAQFRSTLMRTKRPQDATHLAEKTTSARTRSRGPVTRSSTKTAFRGEDANKPFHDHRGCLGPVKDQNNCGACYIFSVNALFEWMYCKQKGRIKSFSEQYAIDCGNHGCSGGLASETVDFYRKFGMISWERYPYFERKKRCPFHKLKRSNSTQMGEIKVDYAVPHRLNLWTKELDTGEQLASGLDESPVLVTISLNDEFYKYGGGVDDALGCTDEVESHAVLLVGDGVEDGNEYWLIRNSHGPDWGEQGYYKMNKKATERCMSEDPGSGITMREGYKFTRNAEYDSSAVDRLLPVWLERLELRRDKQQDEELDGRARDLADELSRRSESQSESADQKV